MKPMQTTPNIELEIAELILHGFAPGDRDRISEALQQELTRLLTVQGIPAPVSENCHLPSLNLGCLHLHPGINPEKIGIQLAQAIYGGLGEL
ncbi:hypothetical protein JYQ62_12000 [Nostoc sp. UHCC 0702]|nr:hypothetical protein JYQ62_12000 [Nostoc sp. UHCC 0702]